MAHLKYALVAVKWFKKIYQKESTDVLSVV
jgi:hypothetical protein